MNQSKECITIKENTVYFLFKRGKKEHINALLENGELYINSIDFIRECDDNQERSDEDDGIKTRNYLGDGKVIICDIGKDLNEDGIEFEASDMTFKEDYPQKGNIFSLTGIYSEHFLGERNDIRFDTKSFGETLIFIHNPKKFLDRVFEALRKEGYSNFVANRVLYYASDYSGEVGFFKKHERFKPQSEFRIFVPNPFDRPIKLNLGSLEDIANTRTGFLKIKYTDGKEQRITF